MIINAKQQLKLYYLVGSEGWATAVNTVKSAEAERLGVPGPVHKEKLQIIYVNKQNYSKNHGAQKSYQSNYKKGGRPHYRK